MHKCLWSTASETYSTFDMMPFSGQLALRKGYHTRAHTYTHTQT